MIKESFLVKLYKGDLLGEERFMNILKRMNDREISFFQSFYIEYTGDNSIYKDEDIKYWIRLTFPDLNLTFDDFCS